MLALVSREHLYVEGPPGAAKTRLAESAAQHAGLCPFVYQLHRDTRLHELVGDALIVRERDSTGAELIRQSTRPGGILSAQIAVLDDISRAPGEALNVLFRVLNERRFACGGESGDLKLSTIATGNPAGPDEPYYTEPLDPASLDRFALQVLSRITAPHNCKTSRPTHSLRQPRPLPNYTSPELQAHAVLPSVSLGPELREVLVAIVQALTERVESERASHLLTDRTFLAKAPLICRAHALMNGRHACEPDDLYAIRHMTAFRLPARVHQQVEEIVADVLAKRLPPASPPPPPPQPQRDEEEGGVRPGADAPVGADADAFRDGGSQRATEEEQTARGDKATPPESEKQEALARTSYDRATTVTLDVLAHATVLPFMAMVAAVEAIFAAIPAAMGGRRSECSRNAVEMPLAASSLVAAIGARVSSRARAPPRLEPQNGSW